MNDLFFRNHLAQTTPFPMVLEVEKASGSRIISKDGKQYIDMVSGLSVSNFGHGHPKIKEAIHEQTEKHLHVMVYGEFRQDPQELCAKNLCSLLPHSLDTVYFVNSGTEAIEAAMKLVKRSTGRSKIISFKGAYHGSTQGAMSVSFNESKKRSYRPLIPGIEFIELNNFHDLESIDSSCAGVFLETIQGDAGIRIPSHRYLEGLRKKCDDVGALLVFDEIQAGMGRTGKSFAFEHYGVTPDLLTLGKALGGGLPIGALISSRKLMENFSQQPMLGHITTFGGNPLICAAANAALNVLKNEIDFEHVEKMGELIESRLGLHEKVIEVRRKGLFIAIELNDADQVQKVVETALKNGVILFWFLSSPQAFRVAPPLNIEEKELEEALMVIVNALNTL